MMSRLHAVVVAVLAAAFLLSLAGSAPAAGVEVREPASEYAGSEACFRCHPAHYSDFMASGHPWKLKPASVARFWPLPLPAGYSWDDISYVIGGYRWKARYMDKNGYIITVTDGKPGNNQYNLATGKWSNYDAGKVTKYACGQCHNTGFSKAGSQDGLPGIVGTWVFPGVQCEACHGPAAAHVASGGDRSLVKVDRSAAMCGQCHVRGNPKVVPASRGFIEHREQYNELLASPHGFLECVDCHNPHKRVEFSIVKTCADCHTSAADKFKDSTHDLVGVDCIDCHMPHAVRNAVAFSKYKGDARTHLMRINTYGAISMFTDDGTRARNFVSLGFACLSCHQNRDLVWAEKHARGVHSVGK